MIFEVCWSNVDSPVVMIFQVVTLATFNRLAVASQVSFPSSSRTQLAFSYKNPSVEEANGEAVKLM